MTKDVRSRLSLPEVLGSHRLRDQAEIYVREAKFHIEIIRFVLKFVFRKICQKAIHSVSVQMTAPPMPYTL